MELQNTVALITGANSGLGRAMALALAGEGVSVALVARNEEKLRGVKNEIEHAGGTAMPAPADVSDPAAAQRAVETTATAFGRLDIVINNAGLGIFKPVDRMEVEEWDRHIAVMLRGAFLITKYALPHLYGQKRGHVVNLSSLWAREFCATCAAYTAAKYGVRGFSNSLREEARPHNVKVTNVMPGTVDTPFFDTANWQADLTQALQPDDVASAVLGALKLPDRAVIEEIVIQAIQPGTGSS